MSDSANMEALQSVAASIEKFSSEFYKVLSKDGSDNLICSPLSVSIVLSMITAGARNNTENELRSGLFLSSDAAVTTNGIQSLIDILNSIRSCELRLANRIFLALEFNVKPEFKMIVETSFRSTVQNIDFKKVSEACEIINNWCSKQTNNRINDIITPNAISATTQLILVNAVYFKGIWKKTFKVNCTQFKPFHINEKITENVPTMHNKDFYNYGRISHLDAHYIELPYKSNSATDAISLFIILPDAINGLTKIENNIDKINFKDLHDRQESVHISLQLPKFKILAQLDLQEVLQKMRMREMFTPSANFLGITDQSLFVSKVIHKAFLEVNEEGSEAAALTAVVMMRCAMPRPSIEIAVNRPFFCAIVATNTGTQLFNARVMNPAIK